MKKLKKEKKVFNKGYIPVMVSLGILVILVLLLIVVIWFEPTIKKNILEKDSNGAYSLNDDNLSVDSSNTKCDKAVYNKIVKAAGNVSSAFKNSTRKTNELIPGLDYDEYDEEDWYYKEYTYKVIFYGLTDDIYLKVTSNATKENSFVIHKNDLSSENVAFETSNVESVYEYKVEIYSANENCSDELIRSFVFKTPKYNVYSQMLLCENSDSELCNPVIYEDFKFQDLVNDTNNNKNDKKNEKSENNKTEQQEIDATKKVTIIKLVIIVSIVIVVLISILFIYIMHRREVKKSEL